MSEKYTTGGQNSAQPRSETDERLSVGVKGYGTVTDLDRKRDDRSNVASLEEYRRRRARELGGPALDASLSRHPAGKRRPDLPDTIA